MHHSKLSQGLGALGREAEEDIERMVREAEEFADAEASLDSW